MSILLEIVAVAAVIFVAAAYVVGRWEDGLAVAPPDAGSDGLPREGRIAPEAVDHARFGLAFRGYRMVEVDDALDRLRDEIAARDAEIEALVGHAETAAPTATPTDEPSDDEG